MGPGFIGIAEINSIIDNKNIHRLHLKTQHP